MSNIPPDNQVTSDSDRYQGEKLLTALNSLVQNLKIHQDHNRLVVDTVDRFVGTVRHIMADDDSLVLQVVNGRFFLQEEKLLYRRETEPFIEKILGYFEERELDGFTIYRGINEAGPENVIAFARFMNQAAGQSNPFDWLQKKLDESTYPWLLLIKGEAGNLDAADVDQTHEEDEKAGGADSPENEGQRVEKLGVEADGGTSTDDMLAQRRQMVRMDYKHALGSLAEVSQKLTQVKRTGIRKAVRLVQRIVENILEDQTIYLAVSTIRLFDDYTYTHSVNVAILAMCFGKQLGLSRNSLENLGICGLFHDLGKIQIPQKIINKPGKLSDEEFTLIRNHSLNSVRLILKLRASWHRKSKILLAPFEHHLKYNLKGYPSVQWERPISLFGRILAIVDVYDALTSARKYRDEAYSPDRALGMMLEGSGHDFDPILLKVFINMLGVYPIGTLLELDTGELGLVCGSAKKEDIYRPTLLLLSKDKKGTFIKGSEIDLAERNQEGGEYLRNIVRSHHPNVFDIQASDFLF